LKLRDVVGTNGIGSSSPISIQSSLNSQNSITTAIRNSVLQGQNDHSGSHSHSRSFNEDLLHQENMKLKKELYSAEVAYKQLDKNARRQADYYKNEYDKARKHIMDQTRELDQLREAMRNVAGGRVIAEIRHAQRTGSRCPASPHDIELILKTLKRDQELLESILDAELIKNS
jgi:hypothetical protein